MTAGGGKAERGTNSSKNRWDCAKCDGKDKLGTGAPCASSASYPPRPPPKVRERWQRGAAPEAGCPLMPGPRGQERWSDGSLGAADVLKERE